VSGRILTGTAIDAHNTFDAPETVKPVAFTGATLQGGVLTVAIPAKAIVMLDIK
jgi:alpha-N-arabinofuranosidase